jgi:hypothetical protein
MVLIEIINFYDNNVQSFFILVMVMINTGGILHDTREDLSLARNKKHI